MSILSTKIIFVSLLLTTNSTMSMKQSKQTSLVWDFFTEKDDWVTCNKCPKSYRLATAKSSTQPLRYHLKTQHGVEFDNAEKSMTSKRPIENNLFPPSKKQKTLFSYIEKKSQLVDYF